MTTTNDQELYVVQAQADLSAQSARFKAITLNGTLFTGTSAQPGLSCGILQSSCRSGEYASYVYTGITKAVAGGAVSTLGYPLTVASGGFLIAAASGQATVGRNIELAASGDMMQCFVDFMTVAPWPGV